jgi:CubicO group peptidase (beta-lactamase class C family)
LKHFLLAIRLSICAVSIAAPPPDFDTRAETLRKQVGAPGMAIAIVENGKVTLAKVTA